MLLTVCVRWIAALALGHDAGVVEWKCRASTSSARALGTGGRHVLGSQRKPRAAPERDSPTIHDQPLQFAGRRRRRLSKRSPPHVPSTNFKYDQQTRTDHPPRPSNGPPAKCLPPNRSAISSISPCPPGSARRVLLGEPGRLIITIKCGIRNVSAPLFGETDISYYFVSTGFVNAQYRFVMNPTADYTVHFADPDMCVPVRALLSDAN
jgi:hypothetical protein